MVACHKDDAIKPSGSTDIFGKWELRNVSGEFDAVIYPPGNGNIIHFDKESTFLIYSKSVVNGQGKFHIKAAKTLNGITGLDSIFYTPAVNR